MKVKALVSFAGSVTMARDEVKDIKEESIVEDLLRAGYVEQVKTTKKVKVDENQ